MPVMLAAGTTVAAAVRTALAAAPGRARRRQSRSLTTEEQAELAQPRRENRRLREDVEILKRDGFPPPVSSFIATVAACAPQPLRWQVFRSDVGTSPSPVSNAEHGVLFGVGQ